MNKKCNALTKGGRPCQAAARSNGLCFFHGDPDKAKELGRMGGRNRGPRAQKFAAPEGIMSLPQRIEMLVQQLDRELIDPPRANSILKAMELQLRIQEKLVIPTEIAKLQESLEKVQLIIKKRDNENSLAEYEMADDEDEEDDEDQQL